MKMIDFINPANWQQLHLLRPLAAILWLPFFIALYLVVKSALTNNNNQKKIAAHLACHLTTSVTSNKRFSPTWLTFIIIALFITILMGPTWQRQSSPLLKDASALIIALDVSQSMLADDIQPSRLERAKQKISDILALRNGGYSSLLIYAGSAHTVLPLTNDSRILLDYLSAVSNKIVPKQGKFAEKIIPLLQQQTIAQGTPVTILLVSDGSSDKTNNKFSDYFTNRDDQLLVLGVGKTLNELTDKQSKIAPLEENSLQQLANITDGSYQKITADKEDVIQLVDKIKGHYVVEDNKQIPWQDAGYFLIFPCLLLYLFWFRKGWKVNWQAYLLLFMVYSSPPPAYAASDSMLDEFSNRFVDLWLTPDQQGHWYYKHQQYLKAAKAFEQLQWKATAYYLAENFTLSAEYFSRSNSKLAQFGLANSLSHLGEYYQAEQVYLTYLANYPSDTAATNNLAIVKRIITTQERLSKELSQKNKQNTNKNKALKLQAGTDKSEKTNTKQKKSEHQKAKQLTAKELLESDRLNKMWLDNLQQSPDEFLANKFKHQFSQKE